MKTSLRATLRTTATLSCLAAAAALSACADMAPMTPMTPKFMQDSLPAAVQVPAGYQVVMETVGSGEIAYECKAKAAMAGEFEWVFVGPKIGRASCRERVYLAV